MTEEKREWNILSYGGGVQSTCILLMSALGELPKLDAAVFCDPGWESRRTYAAIEAARKIAEDRGIPVHTHKRKDIIADVWRGHIQMPVYMRMDSGRVVPARRQCTNEYKITAFRQFVKRGIIGLKPRQMVKGHLVYVWLGISWDERRRVSNAGNDYWQRMTYPLIFDPADGFSSFRQQPLTREWCIQWLGKNFPCLDVPKSACIGCPYIHREDWVKLYRDDPDEFDRNCEVDAKIRETFKNGYLHRRALPLRESVEMDIADGVGAKENDADFLASFSCGTCGT